MQIQCASCVRVVLLALTSLSTYAQTPFITTVAGTSGLGTGSIQLHYPCGITLDAADNLFVADTYNHRVLRITRDGDMTVVAGSGGQGQGDTQLYFSPAVALDSGG